jgi:hypothetical protein
MIKKTLRFEDFDDNVIESEWYFGLSKGELAEQALVFGGADGDYATMLKKIVSNGDSATIIKTFKDIILQSVGKRDGTRFVKNQAIRDEFVDSGAYSALFMELVTNAEEASKFVSGILPSSLAKQIENSPKAGVEGLDDLKPDPVEKNPLDLSNEELVALISGEEPEDTRPLWLKENRKPTKGELVRMSREELMLAYRHNLGPMSIAK